MLFRNSGDKFERYTCPKILEKKPFDSYDSYDDRSRF